MLIRGVAGVGKTHAIIDHALARLERQAPTLVFFGEDFRGGNLWEVMARKLGLGAMGRDELLGAFDAAAEASGALGVLFIDALNETPDRRVWCSWLPALVAQLKPYKHLKLCASCRSTYLEDVLASGLVLPEVEHNGFAGREQEATLRFFEHYGLERPAAPILQAEFSIPLFLHLVCRSLQTIGERRLPVGLQGITDIVNLLMRASNQQVAEAIDYDPREPRVQQAVQAVAQAMAEQGVRSLRWGEAKAMVDALYPSTARASSLFDQLVRTNLLAVVTTVPTGLQEPAWFVRFSFERIADYLLVKHLLDGLAPEGLTAAFQPGGRFHFAVASPEAAQANRGLFEALAIHLPERYGQELPEVVETPEEVILPTSIEALVWRKPETVGTTAFRLLQRGLANLETFGLTFETLLTLSARPGHPLNAKYLHRLLGRFSLAHRDGFWSGFLHESYSAERSVHRHIDWALRGELEGLDPNAVYLWVLALAWCCAAADRRVRDRATRAMVRLLRSRPGLAPELIEDLGEINDDYVWERVLGACYVVVLLSRESQVIRDVAAATWTVVFEAGRVPLNALVRDHVRLILELALQASALPEGATPERFRPPYDSPFPIEYPTEEVAPLKEQEAFQPLDLESPLSDFATYKVEPKAIRPFDQDPIGVRRWFLKEAAALGYPGPNASCARYDGYMTHKYGSGRARVGWAERIGKKYYWILLQRLVGQLSDHLEQTEFDEPVKQPSEPPLQGMALRDIDPTDIRGRTSTPEREWYVSKAYTFDTRWDLTQQEWLSLDDFPEPTDFFTAQGEKGVLWTPLHLSKRWEASQDASEEERYPRRSVALLLQSALVRKEHLADIELSLRQAEFNPDIYDLCMEEYQGYLAEYPYGVA